MDENLIFDLTRQALWIAVRMSAPLLPDGFRDTHLGRIGHKY